jgi:hypothetical protein
VSPSLFLPVFVQPDAQEPTVRFYEQALGATRRPALAFGDSGLRLVPVGQVLVITGDDHALGPVREVGAVFLVDSLAEARSRLQAAGAAIVPAAYPAARASGPERPLSATSLYARHPDGTLAEYVEHSA